MPRTVLALTALLLSLLLAPVAAHAAVSPAGSASIAGTGSAAASLTVPEGSRRFLAVGVSTLESANVTSVTYGAQVLTRLTSSAKDSSRAEVWTIKDPNPGTATVTVTLSSGAPLVIGATTFTGVDPYDPVLTFNSVNQNTSANSAGIALNGTVVEDGMFGVISINAADNITAIRTTGSVDTVVADKQWSGAGGSVIGAGATRSGNTGQNMALNAGIGWFWNRIDPSRLMPYSNVLVALKAATIDPPTVSSPTATGVTHNAATLGGTVSDNGGGALTSRGVAYCQCADPKLGGAGVTKVELGTSQTLGAFSTAVTGLAPNTTYTYAAYAGNAFATRYTSTATFKTEPQPNRAPTADAGGEYIIDEGAPLTLDGSGTDADGDTLTYSWDVNGDGVYGDATGASPTLSHAQLTALGLGDGYVASIVRVRVSDGKLETTSGATRLQVANVAPTGTLRNSGPVDEGGTATVTFTGQSDPVDTELRYAYDFDDDGTWEVGGSTFATASTSASATVPAARLADGAATVRVRARVIDKDGGFDETATDITVRNLAPTAKLDDVTVDEGATATIKLTDIADVAADAPGLRYAYDLDGNGTFEVTSSTETSIALSTSLTADGPAERTVRASVTDKDGGTNTYTAKVSVTNVAPTATLNGDAVDEGASATVTFSGQDDVSADDKAAGFTYEFDLDGDGVFEVKGIDPKATLKTTDGPATLPIKGAIIDRDNGRREYSTTVEVRNAAPALTLAGTGSATAGASYALTLTGADAGGDALTGTIDWGDGTTDAFAATAEHVYGTAGTYTVTATVRDEDGAATTATHVVAVASAPAAPAPEPTPAPAATPAPSTGVLGVEATNVKLSGLRITGSRCISSPELRAVTSAAKTLKVQFRLSAGAQVKFTLKRWNRKPGASKCPPSSGVAQKGGSKIPGTYSPFSNRAVTAKAGLNTVTLATTAGKGKALKPGTYLLTIASGETTAQTKVWVLAR